MKQRFKQFISNFSKKDLVIIFFVYLLTFINDSLIFKNEKPFTNYLYPYSHENYYLKYILLKIIVLFIIAITVYGIKKFRNNNDKNKKKIVSITFIFVVTLEIVFMLFNKWGYSQGDVVHIFDFATKLEFVPWHNIFTSLYYMIALSFVPHAAGVTIFTIILLALAISISASLLYDSKRKYLILLLIIFMCTLPNRSYGIWPFRTTFSAYLELILITLFLIYNKGNKYLKYLIFVLIAFLSTYRSESIFYLLLPLAMLENENIKEFIVNYLIIIILMIAFMLPQSYYSNKYYNKDYLQVNTYSTIQYIYNTNYYNDVSKNDKKIIDKVIPIEYLKDYGSHSYFEINYKRTKTGTKTGLSKELQNKFFKAVLKLFWKNKKLVYQHKMNNLTGVVLNKTYYDNYQAINKSQTYFFAVQSGKIHNRYNQKYNVNESRYKYNFLNFNMGFNMLFVMILMFITIFINFWKKNYKILLVILALILKMIGIVLLAPNMSCFYFYYLYLIIPILFIYGLVYKGNKMLK